MINNELIIILYTFSRIIKHSSHFHFTVHKQKQVIGCQGTCWQAGEHDIWIGKQPLPPPVQSSEQIVIRPQFDEVIWNKLYCCRNLPTLCFELTHCVTLFMTYHTSCKRNNLETKPCISKWCGLRRTNNATLITAEKTWISQVSPLCLLSIAFTLCSHSVCSCDVYSDSAVF